MHNGDAITRISNKPVEGDVLVRLWELGGLGVGGLGVGRIRG